MPRKPTKWALERRRAGMDAAKAEGRPARRSKETGPPGRPGRPQKLTQTQVENLRADVEEFARKKAAMQAMADERTRLENKARKKSGMKSVEPPVIFEWADWWRPIAKRYGIESRATMERYLGRRLTECGVVVKPRPQTPGETYMERLMRDLGRSLNRPVKRMPRDAESVHQLLTKWKTFDDKVKVIYSLEVLAYLFAKYSEMPNSLDKTQYLASIERQMKRISESE